MPVKTAPVKVAIVGRPNVGKSTLFNRLIGKRLALVDDQPGVTRDRREGEGRLFDLSFVLFDTAGLEEAPAESLEGRMSAQSRRAVDEADVALFLIDARAGLTPVDEAFARSLRKGKTPIILCANKTEGRAAEAGLAEAFRLGLGEPIPLSGEHGLGLDELYDRLAEIVPQARDEHPAAQDDWDQQEEGLEGADEAFDEEADEEKVLQLAIVGRPNVGKSTLVNQLVGEDRLLTGPEAGITRDAIALDWDWKGRPVKLVDTAGLRRRAKVQSKVEKLSAADTRRVVDFAHVVVLMLDAADPEGQGVLEKQDLTIARHVVEEGRALVLALNKWDAVKDRQAAMQSLKDRLLRSFPQTKGIPIVTLSAKEGQGLDKLMKAVFRIYDLWNSRLPTAALNRWLEDIVAHHPPPAPGGRPIRLKYMTQAKTRPPTFAIFCSKPKDLPGSYLRYLENALRQDFDLPGTPIRINIRKSSNPYVDKG